MENHIKWPQASKIYKSTRNQLPKWAAWDQGRDSIGQLGNHWPHWPRKHPELVLTSKTTLIWGLLDSCFASRAVKQAQRSPTQSKQTATEQSRDSGADPCYSQIVPNWALFTNKLTGNHHTDSVGQLGIKRKDTQLLGILILSDLNPLLLILRARSAQLPNWGRSPCPTQVCVLMSLRKSHGEQCSLGTRGEGRDLVEGAKSRVLVPGEIEVLFWTES